MALGRLIEQLLKQGKSCGDSIQNCFTSLMEVSIQLKELQDGKGDEVEDEDGVDEDSDDDDSEDYDEVNLYSFFMYISF
jgi:hypothetical protein